MKKRIIALLLVTIIFSSAFIGIYSYIEANNYDSPSVVLLDSMLYGERGWVIDTIVYDNRVNNPYDNGDSLMSDAISQYENENDPDFKYTYKFMVDALLEFYYQNTWVKDWTAYAAESVAELEVLFSGEEGFFSFVDDITKSAEEEQFENILYGVFTDKYVSSWGESVNEQEASLQQLNELSATLDSMKNITDYWSGLYSISSDTEDAETIIDYMENVAIPLKESGSDYLNTFDNLDMREQQVAGSVITLASTLAIANWASSHSKTYSGCTPLSTDLLDMVAGERAASILSAAGTGLDFSSGLITQYTFLNSLCQQQDTYHNTLIRMAQQANASGESKMSDVLYDYADKMDDAVDTNQLRYDLLVNSIASSSTINKNLKLSSAMKAGMPQSLKNAYKAGDYASLASIFNVGMTVIDETTGLKNTCLKTSELLYLREVINEAKKVYQSDVKAYESNKTEENAKKVLCDLQILQRLRLRGENIAYKMAKGQLNSWLGRLISGYNSGDWSQLIDDDTELAAAWKENYQQSIDALIGASIDPISFQTFNVSSGEKIVIYYNAAKNTYQGAYTKGGKTTNIYEMQYRIMSGINVTGGTLAIKDASVPFITASSGSSVSIDAATTEVGELTQNGGTISVVNSNLRFQNCLDLANAELNLNGNIISTPDTIFNGEIIVADGIIETHDLHLSKAQVTGAEIRCDGDVDSSSSTCSDLIICGGNRQTVAGGLTVGNLILDNRDDKGITVSGTVSINGSLTDLDNIVESGLKLISGADIVGDTLASDIILAGANISHPVTYKRSVEISGNSVISGGIAKGLVEVLSGGLTNQTGELVVKNDMIVKAPLIIEESIDVKGEMICSGATITVKDSINVKDTLHCTGTIIQLADTKHTFVATENVVLNNVTTTGEGKFVINDKNNSISGSGNVIENLEVSGTRKQVMDFGGTVQNLTLANTSYLGVNFTKSINVTNCFNAANQKLIDGTNIILTGEATACLDNVQGNLTISGWSGSIDGKLNGDIYATGVNSIKQNYVWNGGLIQNSGTINLEDVELSLKGNFTQKSGTLNISSNSILTMNTESGFSGTINNDGEMKLLDQAVFAGILYNYGKMNLLSIANLSGTCVNEGKITSQNQFKVTGTISGGGQVLLYGDLSSSKDLIFAELHLLGNEEQTISGANYYVKKLVNNNNTHQGVQMDAQVYVSESYVNNGHIRGKKPLCSYGYTYAGTTNLSSATLSQNTSVNGSLNLTGISVIEPGVHVEVLGNLNVSNTLTVSEGAVINISGNLICSSGTIVIAEGALVNVRNNMIFNSVTLQIDGECTVTQDVKLTGGTVQGKGKFIIIGDLNNSATISSLNCIGFNGRAPQAVSGNNIYVNKVELKNSSTSGINLKSYIYYTDNKEIAGNCHVDESYVIEVTE